MDFKDYYAILGVAKDADDKTIKKAYQKLAKQYHPDVNPGNKAAEDKFKDISEAYQAIGDPEKRRKYDELRNNYQAWKNRGGSGEFDWSRWQAQPGEGTYTRTVTPEEFAQMFGDLGGGFSGEDFSDFFSTIFGMGDPMGQQRGRHTARAHPSAQTGQDFELEVNITLEEAYHGTTRVIDTGEKQIHAKIPKGVKTGSKVRLAGQGQPGFRGGARGDLYLLINVEPHTSFSREGDNLVTEVPVDFYTAVLGGEASVKTLNGEVRIKIPPQTQSKTKLRLKGKGMPRLENGNEAGDLFAQIQIVLPGHLNQEEISALKSLGEKFHR